MFERFCIVCGHHKMLRIKNEVTGDTFEILPEPGLQLDVGQQPIGCACGTCGLIYSVVSVGIKPTKTCL